MTDQERKAIEMALETMEGIVNSNWRKWEELASPEDFERWVKSRANHCAEAIRQVLAQPEQEPVAWIRSGDDQLSLTKGKNDGYMVWKPLYTAPPSKPWVSLTDEEIKEGAKYSWVDYQAFQSVAWWADDKLKEKNT